MKKLKHIFMLLAVMAAHPCLAQDDVNAVSTPDGRDTVSLGLPVLYGGYLPSLAADTAFYPRLYCPLPYYMGGWQLHSGLNAQLGTSVTVGFGKHAPKGVGIGTHAAFLYAAPLSPRLSVAAGISSQTLDWGGVKLRDAELMGVAAYKVNDFMNVYAYGAKSLLDDKRRRVYPYPGFARDRLGGAVDFNIGGKVFIQFGVEHATYH